VARRVHILGASGSGTTTPGQALAARLGCPHVAFMKWAADYDEGGLEIRSFRLHHEWLAALPGPV
jgi:adenylate kinase family enzyme